MENGITEQLIRKIDNLSRRLYKINKKLSEYDETNSDEFNRYYFISTTRTTKRTIKNDTDYYNYMLDDKKYKKLMNKKLLIETELDYCNRTINNMESMF